MTIHRQVLYSGYVQGVGFRWTVKQLAAGYDVIGWVRNLPDGRVELHAGGEPKEVEAFLKAISTSQLAPHIEEAQETDSPQPLIGAGFTIRH